MIETMLYLNGNCPKTISFVDEETKSYVVLKVKLRKDISEFAFKKFLFEMKYLKASLLAKGISNVTIIQKLKSCFKEILETESVINLKSLYELMNSLGRQEFLVLNQSVESFFDMFEIINRNESTLKIYNEMINHLQMSQVFMKKDSNFEQEVKAMKYNSYFFNSNYMSKCEKLAKENHQRRRLLIKEKNIG